MFLQEPLVLLMILVIIASALYYYRSTIIFRQKLRRVQGPIETHEGVLKDQATTECPRCGRQMDGGYLIGPGGLYWSKVAPLYQDVSGLLWRRGLGAPMGSEPLGSTMFRSIGRLPHLTAHRCTSCNLVYIDLQSQTSD